MKLDESADVRVYLLDGTSTSFPNVRQAMLYVWDNTDSVSKVLCNGSSLAVGDDVWKR